VCFMVEGKPRFRVVGLDLEEARRQREVLVQAAERGRSRSRRASVLVQLSIGGCTATRRSSLPAYAGRARWRLIATT
jgi:hypothetical protein